MEYTFPFTLSVPPKANEVFAPSAAENQEGKTMTFLGKECVIKKAWVDNGVLYLTLDEGEKHGR